MAGLEIKHLDRHRPGRQECAWGHVWLPDAMGMVPQPFTQAAGHSGEPAGLQTGSGGRPVHSRSSALAVGSGGRDGGLCLSLEWDREVKLSLWHGQFLE